MDHILPPTTSALYSCPKCGKATSCDLEKGLSTCWCFSMPTSELTAETGQKCLCRQCLNEQINRQKQPQ